MSASDPLGSMVYVDWISASEHANFNRAFFSVIPLVSARLYVFNPHLELTAVACTVLSDCGGRLARFLSVLRVCVQNRHSRVILLTYDPILLPLVTMLGNVVGVYEHNTTPERASLSKHVVWQRLFLRRVVRFAQFPPQLRILQALGQKGVYIGSPIIPPAALEAGLAAKDGLPGVYIVPSYRASLGDLQVVAPLVAGQKVLAKKVGVGDHISVHGLELEMIDYFDLKKYRAGILGIIVTVQSRIRATGWYNDAIAMGLPIIITNSNARELFEEIFPGYPYVNALEFSDAEAFEARRRIVASFDSQQYVIEHNRRIGQRLAPFLG